MEIKYPDLANNMFGIINPEPEGCCTEFQKTATFYHPGNPASEKLCTEQLTQSDDLTDQPCTPQQVIRVKSGNKLLVLKKKITLESGSDKKTGAHSQNDIEINVRLLEKVHNSDDIKFWNKLKKIMDNDKPMTKSESSKTIVQTKRFEPLRAFGKINFPAEKEKAEKEKAEKLDRKISILKEETPRQDSQISTPKYLTIDLDGACKDNNSSNENVTTPKNLFLIKSNSRSNINPTKFNRIRALSPIPPPFPNTETSASINDTTTNKIQSCQDTVDMSKNQDILGSGKKFNHHARVYSNFLNFDLSDNSLMSPKTESLTRITTATTTTTASSTPLIPDSMRSPSSSSCQAKRPLFKSPIAKATISLNVTAKPASLPMKQHAKKLTLDIKGPMSLNLSNAVDIPIPSATTFTTRTAQPPRMLPMLDLNSTKDMTSMCLKSLISPTAFKRNPPSSADKKNPVFTFDTQNDMEPKRRLSSKFKNEELLINKMFKSSAKPA
jgi:hypothetical protein